ncbi:MAG: oligosaccharide flippase family protein, partial [Anaerolineales bacterium]
MEEVTFSQEEQSYSLEKRTVLILAKGSAIGLLGRLLGRFLMLVYQALLARSLGRDQYGLFALGWSVLQISLYMGPVGLGQAVLRFASPLWKKDGIALRRILQQSLAVATLTGFLLGGVLFFSSPVLAAFFQKPGLLMVWRATALALFLSTILRTLSAMTRISQRVQFSLLVEDILLPLSMALTALFLTMIWHWGIQGALFSVVLGYALMTWLAMIFVRILFPSAFVPVPWEREVFRSLSTFSLSVSLGTLANLLTQWMPRLILGYFRPEAEVGLYQAAFQVASLPALILASTGPIFAPVIARLSGERKFQQVKEVYTVVTKWTVYLSAPLVVTLFFFPRPLLYLFFGSEYEGAT